MVKMQVLLTKINPKFKSALIMLVDLQEKRVLPIRTGVMEGLAIALEMEKEITSRPLSHDLMKNILDELHVEVAKVVVTEIKDDTFYAVIRLVVGGKELEIDSRPSDAIALAARVKAPIYCTEKVLEAAIDLKPHKERSRLDDSDDLKKWLESLKPDEFGEYKM
ncbi:bifunctional nuclease family protein [bacterium]|nr:bifunctional nuclease family protein [bacterium]